VYVFRCACVHVRFLVRVVCMHVLTSINQSLVTCVAYLCICEWTVFPFLCFFTSASLLLCVTLLIGVILIGVIYTEMRHTPNYGFVCKPFILAKRSFVQIRPPPCHFILHTLVCRSLSTSFPSSLFVPMCSALVDSAVLLRVIHAGAYWVRETRCT